MDFIDTFDPITEDGDTFPRAFVSDVIKQTMVDIGDLKASLYLWDTEERKTSDHSEDVLKLCPVTRGKAEVYLDMFFKMQLWSAKSLKEPQQDLNPKHNMTSVLNKDVYDIENEKRLSSSLSAKLRSNSPSSPFLTPNKAISPDLMSSLSPVESKSPGSLSIGSGVRVKMGPPDLISPKLGLGLGDSGFPQKPEEKPCDFEDHAKEDQHLIIPRDRLSADFLPRPEMCEVTAFPVSSPPIPIEAMKMRQMFPQSFGNTFRDSAAVSEKEGHKNHGKNLPPNTRLSRYSGTPDMPMNMDLTDSSSPTNVALAEAVLNSIPPADVDEALVQYTQHLVQCFKALENQESIQRKTSISDKRSFSNCSARLEKRRPTTCCASFLQTCTRASAPELAYEYAETFDENGSLTSTRTDFKETSITLPAVSEEEQDKEKGNIIPVPRSLSYSSLKSEVGEKMASAAFSLSSTMSQSIPEMADGFSQILNETLSVSSPTSEKGSTPSRSKSKSENDENCINAQDESYDSDIQSVMVSETTFSSRSQVLMTSAFFSTPTCRTVSVPELTVSFSPAFEETHSLSPVLSGIEADDGDHKYITIKKTTSCVSFPTPEIIMETCSPNFMLPASSTVSMQEWAGSQTVEETCSFSPTVSEMGRGDGNGQNVFVPGAVSSSRCSARLQVRDKTASSYSSLTTDTAVSALQTLYTSPEVLKETRGSSSALPETDDTQRSYLAFSVEERPGGTAEFTTEIASSTQAARDSPGFSSATWEVESDKDGKNTTILENSPSTSCSTKSKMNTKIDSSNFSSFHTAATLTEAILCTFPVTVVDEDLKKYTENLVKCFKMLESQEDFKDRKNVIISEAKSSLKCSSRAGRRTSSSGSHSRPSLRRTTSLSLSTPELAARCYQVCSESPGVSSAISEETCSQSILKLKEEKYFREIIDSEARSSSSISALRCKRTAHVSSSPLCASASALSVMKIDEEVSPNSRTPGGSSNWSSASFSSTGAVVPTPEIADICSQTQSQILSPAISKNEEVYSLSPEGYEENSKNALILNSRLSSSSSTRPEVGSTIPSSSPTPTAQYIPENVKKSSEVFDAYQGQSLAMLVNEETSFLYQTKPGIGRHEGNKEDLTIPKATSSFKLPAQLATDIPSPGRIESCFQALDESSGHTPVTSDMMRYEESKSKMISEQHLPSKSSAGFHLSGNDLSPILESTRDLVRRSSQAWVETPSIHATPSLSKAKADNLSMADVQTGQSAASYSNSHFKAKTENIKIYSVIHAKPCSLTTDEEPSSVSENMSKNVNIFQSNPTGLLQGLSKKEQHEVHDKMSKMDDTRPTSNCSVRSDVGVATSSSDSDPSPSTSAITEAILRSIPLEAVDEELKRYTHRLVHCFTMLEKQGESKNGKSSVTTKSRSSSNFSSKKSSGSSGFNTRDLTKKTQAYPAQPTDNTNQQQTKETNSEPTVRRKFFNGGQYNKIKPLFQKDLKQEIQHPAASSSTKKVSNLSSNESVKFEEDQHKKSLWKRFASARNCNKTDPLSEKNQKVDSHPTQTSTAEHTSHMKSKIDELPKLENKKPAETLTKTDSEFQQKTSDLPKKNKEKNSVWWKFCCARRRNKIHPLPDEP